VQHRQHGDAAWAALVRSIGDGSVASLAGHALHAPAENKKAVALELLTHVFHVDDAADEDAAMRRAAEWLFGRVDAQGRPDRRGRLCTNGKRVREGAAAEAAARGVTTRVVVCAKNKRKARWNEVVRTMLEEDAQRLGEAEGRTYVGVNQPWSANADDGAAQLAAQAVEEDERFTAVDPTWPEERLRLHVGDTVMLAQSADPHGGLAKNTLYAVEGLHRKHVVVRSVARPDVRRAVVRMRFTKDPKGFALKRALKQLPLVHAWAVTANKSQGQNYERSLLELRDAFWEHGQGYVAAGRTQAAEDTGAFVNDECCVPRTGGGVPVPVMAATCIPQLLARE
jgi:hypothetical protein